MRPADHNAVRPGPRKLWTGMPRISLPLTSPEPPGNRHRLKQLCPAAADHWPPDRANDPIDTRR